jgi:4-amino-4-deoxy-L-arabinose transferase-like glycosyltransferase
MLLPDMRDSQKALWGESQKRMTPAHKIWITATIKEFMITKRGNTRPFVTALFVALLAAFLVLPFQGSRGLWEPDEGRYSCAAVQMLRTGDFLNPAWNDEVPNFTKPPLTYWAIAGGIALFGRNEWGARMANALAFVATLVVVYWIARIFTPARPWLPPLIYATLPVPFAAANLVTTDTLLTLWEGVAVLGFVSWWESVKKRRAWLFVMWSGFGLAFLTKGPPGLLPLMAIFVFVWLAKGCRSVFQLVSLGGFLVFAVAGLGWYVVVALTHPDLMAYFIQDEFIRRIATSSYHRNPEWYKPFVIYLPVLILGGLPHTYFLLRAAGSLPQTLLSRRWWRNSLAHDSLTAFLVLWFFIPFAIFWFSRSRLPLYILPLFIPLALTAERWVGRRPLRRLTILLIVAWMLCLIAIKWGATRYPYQKDSRPIALAIASAIDPIPNEVLFVDSSAFWGVSLYLGCEVEEAASGRKAVGRNITQDTLAEELAQMESGTLVVVLKRDAERVLTILGELRYEAKILGEFQQWVFIAPRADLVDR